MPLENEFQVIDDIADVDRMIKQREEEAVPSSMNTKSDILERCGQLQNMGQDDL